MQLHTHRRFVRLLLLFLTLTLLLSSFPPTLLVAQPATDPETTAPADVPPTATPTPHASTMLSPRPSVPNTESRLSATQHVFLPLVSTSGAPAAARNASVGLASINDISVPTIVDIAWAPTAATPPDMRFEVTVIGGSNPEVSVTLNGITASAVAPHTKGRSTVTIDVPMNQSSSALPYTVQAGNDLYNGTLSTGSSGGVDLGVDVGEGAANPQAYIDAWSNVSEDFGKPSSVVGSWNSFESQAFYGPTGGTVSARAVLNPACSRVFFVLNKGTVQFLSVYENNVAWLGAPNGKQGSPPDPTWYPDFAGNSLQTFQYGFIGSNNGSVAAYPYYPTVGATSITFDPIPGSDRQHLEIETTITSDPVNPNSVLPMQVTAYISYLGPSILELTHQGGGVYAATSMADFPNGFPTGADIGVTIGAKRLSDNLEGVNPPDTDHPVTIGTETTIPGRPFPIDPTTQCDTNGGGGIFPIPNLPPSIALLEPWPNGHGAVAIGALATDDNDALSSVSLQITNGVGTLQNGGDMQPHPGGDPNIYWAIIEDVPPNAVVEFTATATDDIGQSAQASGDTRVPFSAGFGNACRPHCMVLNPVNTAIGNDTEQVIDLVVPGPPGSDTDIVIARGHNSQDETDGPFGWGSSFAYLMTLEFVSNPLLDGIQVHYGDGHTANFSDNGNGTYAPVSPDNFETITKVGDTYELHTQDYRRTHVFDDEGRLTAIRNQNGATLTLGYSGDQLTSISNPAGRSVTLTWAGDYIEHIEAPEGKVVRYQYNGDRLVGVTNARGHTTTYEHDSRTRITAVIDPNGDYVSRQEFDDRGRVVWQIMGEPDVPTPQQARWTFSYDDDTHTTVVRDPLGYETTYNYTEEYIIQSVTNALGQANESQHNDRGNLTRYIDRRGNTTQYEYDARGNLTRRIDPVDPGFCAAYNNDSATWAYNSQNKVIQHTDALGYVTTFAYDPNGNLIAINEPNGRTTTMTYNALGQVRSITDANGNAIRFAYNAAGDLVRTIDALGNVSRSTYDSAGREVSYTTFNGFTYRYTYDENDNITSITDPLGNVTTFTFDANDLLTGVVDRRGGAYEYRYNASRNLSSERDPAGAWTSYQYDVLHQPVMVTDPLGHVTRYSYDPLGLTEAITNPIGAVTRFAYDEDGNLTEIVDALNQRTDLAYDAMDRVADITDAEANTTQFCYDAEDRLRAMNGPRGEDDVTRFTYDGLDQLLTEIDPLGNLTEYVYDPVGNQIAQISPLKQRTDYTYDKLDRLTAVAQPVLPDGQRPTTRFTYDAAGNMISLISPRNHVTRFAYDELDNLARITDARGSETILIYDEAENPVTIIDANGNPAHISYDLRGLPTAMRDALDYEATMTYDLAGRLIRSTDEMSETTSYAYDPTGALIKEVDPLGHVTRYERDLLGRVVGVTNANQNTTAYRYDGLDRLTHVIDALGNITQYGYDEVGNLTNITDANDRTTRFVYTLNNQLARETNPLGESWRYAYDGAGRLIRAIDPRQQSTHYDYDSNDRLTDVFYGPDATAQAPLRFAYDLDGNQTQMCDGLGCLTHTYDELGRQTSTTDWLGRTVGREYDAVSNLTGLIYPNGHKVRYDYNANNWLTSVTYPTGGHSLYQHNARGQVTGIRHPNETLATYTHDDAGRLTGVDNRQVDAPEPQSAFAYVLDSVGNRTQVTETRAAFDGSDALVVLERSYTYDAVNRLVRAATTDPTSTTRYDFDAVGNRLSKLGSVLAPDPATPELPVAPQPEQVEYAYNEANQLVSIDDQEASTDLDYDANGNRQRTTEVGADGSTIVTDYRYDLEDRLIEVVEQTNGVVTMRAVYTYDGYGRRVMKDVTYPDGSAPDQTITYLYDGLDIIGAQVEQSGAVSEAYYYLAPSPVTGMRRPVAMERLDATGAPGDRYWYQADGQDSIVGLTDENGDLTAPLLYDEYGQLLVGDTDLQIFTYTAQDYDPETGLLHFYARYYDPATGAWLTQDSYRGQLLDPVSLHRYGYVGGNPVSYWDLLGWKTYYLHGTHADAPQKDSDDYKFAEDFASRVWNDEDVEYLEWNSWYAPEYNGRPGELNNDRISRGMAAINLAYAIRSYLAMHPEECDNINLMGHSHGGNVIIEALGILQAWGIHINGVALFGTPVRSDYTIPSNSVSKVYNVYGEQRISVRPPSISSRVDLSAKANLDIDVNLDTGGIGFRLPTYGNLNPIQVRPPRLSVDMESHLEVNIDASVDIDAGRIDVEGDYVPLAACTDYGPQHAHGFENICGIAGQRRSDPEVDIVNANVPGLNPTSAHSDVKNPDYLRNSSEVCQNIPGYCD